MSVGVEIRRGCRKTALETRQNKTRGRTPCKGHSPIRTGCADQRPSESGEGQPEMGCPCCARQSIGNLLHLHRFTLDYCSPSNNRIIRTLFAVAIEELLCFIDNGVGVRTDGDSQGHSLSRQLLEAVFL
jgi:hypothetical protein